MLAAYACAKPNGQRWTSSTCLQDHYAGYSYNLEGDPISHGVHTSFHLIDCNTRRRTHEVEQVGWEEACKYFKGFLIFGANPRSFPAKYALLSAITSVTFILFWENITHCAIIRRICSLICNCVSLWKTWLHNPMHGRFSLIHLSLQHFETRN